MDEVEGPADEVEVETAEEVDVEEAIVRLMIDETTGVAACLALPLSTALVTAESEVLSVFMMS